MRTFWRDLLLATLSWLCGVEALRYFPATPVFRPHRLADWLTLAVFEPLSLMVSALLFATGTFLACQVIARNGKQLWLKLWSWSRDAWFHFLALAYACYVLAIQFAKVPLATALLVAVIAVWGFIRFLRIRSLATELDAWKSRND